MPYQSIHTGQSIDESVSINSNQNDRLNDAETKITNLQNSLYNTGSQNQFLIKGANNTTSWKTVTTSIQMLQNISVKVSNWIDDTTYEDFPFKASINIPGCTENDGGQIIFSVSDAIAGIFAPVGQTSNNVIFIYGNEKVDVTIPTILIFKQ